MLNQSHDSEHSKKGWLTLAGLTAGPAVLLSGVAFAYVRRYHMPFTSVAGVYGCFILLLAFAIAPGLEPFRSIMRQRLNGGQKLYPFLLLSALPYLVYSSGTGDVQFRKLAVLSALGLSVPLLYIVFPIARVGGFGSQDACASALLVGTVMSGLLKGVWRVPVNLDFMARLFVIAIGAWCWTFVRPVPRLSYDFRISRQIFRAAALNFLRFAAIAIPLGLLIKFTSWNPQWHGTLAFLLSYLEIFLFIALLEELFFRGFLQSLLTASLQSWWKAQLVVACIFGLFHILHAPFPNWRYVILATIAGWFYGSAFRQAQSVIASSFMHAAVDTVWRTFLSRG
jgi:uncharacterized protein